MAGLQESRVNRIAAWLYGLSSAALATLAIREFLPSLGIRPFALIFFGLWIVSVFAWRWIFFDRPRELDRKMPISSRELRKRKKEFFDRLPR
jgi:hypothetical protein